MDITKLLMDGGSIAAIIVLVIIFLKYQTGFNNKLESISKDFSTKVDNINQSFTHQVDIMAKSFLDHERVYQQQIQTLITDFMSVSREMIVAVKELEAAVKSLREEVIRGHKK